MDSEQMVESSAARRARRTAFIFGGVLIALLVAWVLTAPRENLATDWTAFDTAADRLLGRSTVYRPWSEAERLPYLYPPPALLLTLPLAIWGFYGSFLTSFLLSTSTTFVAIRLLTRADKENPDFKAAITVSVLNGFVITASLIGQYSGLWLLSLAAGLALWTRGREFVAGIALGFLALKPNLAIPVLIVLFWSRSWRVLAGSAAGVVALIVASLPLGLDQWAGFGRNLCAAADLQRLSVLDSACVGTNAAFSDSAFRDVAPIDKMVTTQSSFSTILDLGSDSSLLVALWLAVAAMTGVCVLQLWQQQNLAASVPRAFGAIVLFLVAANPRLYFYDGLLLLLPALVYWSSGRTWIRNESIHRACNASFAVLWLGSWGGIWKGLNVIVGPTAALILVLWALDSWRYGTKTDDQGVDKAENADISPNTEVGMVSSARSSVKSSSTGL